MLSLAFESILKKYCDSFRFSPLFSVYFFGKGSGSAKVLVPIQDIMYIQMKDHYGDVFVVSGKKYLWRISLAKIESYLAQFHFERCHNSCIVNMNYVAEKVKNKFILTDGHTITIGRTYIKSINQRYKSLGKGERE